MPVSRTAWKWRRVCLTTAQGLHQLLEENWELYTISSKKRLRLVFARKETKHVPKLLTSNHSQHLLSNLSGPLQSKSLVGGHNHQPQYTGAMSHCSEMLLWLRARQHKLPTLRLSSLPSSRTPKQESMSRLVYLYVLTKSAG